MKLPPLSAFAAIILIIAQNFQIASLCFHARHAFFTALSRRFPLRSPRRNGIPRFFALNRPGASILGHIQTIIDHMGKYIVKSSACMTCLEAYTDPGAVILINRFLCQNNKSGHIAVIFADILCQNLQIVNPPGSPAGNRCVSLIPRSALTFWPLRRCWLLLWFSNLYALPDIPYTGRAPRGWEYTPAISESSASCRPSSTCSTFENLLSHDKQIIFCQKVINICHQSQLWNFQ